MSIMIWLAVGIFLVMEGIGPLLFPHAWRRMLVSILGLPEHILRRIGGAMVVSGGVIVYMLLRR